MNHELNQQLDICLSDGFNYLFPVDTAEVEDLTREYHLADFDILNSVIEG